MDPAAGAIEAFADELRQLRAEAGNPTYRELADRTAYSATSLSMAAGGRAVPSLAVTLAFAAACGGDPALWQKRWEEMVVAVWSEREAERAVRAVATGGPMDNRTVGELRILTPGLNPGDLDPLSEPPDDDVADVYAQDEDWSGLDLAGVRISGSLLVGVDLIGAAWRNVRLVGCRLERVDLSGARLTGLTVERCEFVGCRMTGVQLADATLKNVIFEDCRFDYANLSDVRAAAPVAWTGCTLANGLFTRCRLPTAALHNCRMSALELVDCDLRGADLRDSDVSGLTGLSSLAGVTIAGAQLSDVATVAIRDLDLDVRES